MTSPKKSTLPSGSRFLACDIGTVPLSWAVFEVVGIETDTLSLEVRLVGRCRDKDDALALVRAAKIQEGG